ncbi:hypothetical protein BT93_L5174 [Corymbia citriodora subsp. variegata]|uniref:F-box domain-containing protein n=1 Tax=Corymbia citriodora subsp. variegata TaxID=360336 RepID=A0A8T0CWA7_CORYI|nr:hypothetical protein BT93_L5174 [Corymbia citriodora subsp. variegata]
MHRRLHQPHLPPSDSPALSPSPSSDDAKRGKKRGSYNCGRCGLPKKGHSCHAGGSSSSSSTADSSAAASTPVSAATSAATAAAASASAIALVPPTHSSSAARPPQPPPLLPRHPISHLRRALSFDDLDVRADEGEDFDEVEPDLDERDEDFVDGDADAGGLPARCLWEVLRRLPPAELLAAAKVCKGWRDTSRRVWRAAEDLKLRVPARAQLRFVGSVLNKCPELVRLSLRMESDVDATMLACIAFSCPNLEYMEISTSSNAVNRITGDELGRFVADKRCLTCLKMEGCSNLGGLVLSSSSLSTLWLSDLHSLSKMVFNCPNLREISLEFSCNGNDCTDLIALVDGLGRTCPRLQNIHIASVRLSHAVVLALTASNLRGLRMLSLVLGSDITDASVAAIASSFSDLELLDLSGSSISDSGIGMICNVFPETLSRLLLALCPNISSSGIQFATAQLPLLELMDCGMTVCDTNDESLISDEAINCGMEKRPNNNIHLIHQKLIIKHSKLKKLSLWGCSGLDALYLNCPELNDLNLNACKNLLPDRLLIQCPSLENVYASGCQELLIEVIQNQVNNDSFPVENHLPFKRLADGSKRIRVPHFLCQQQFDVDKQSRRRRPCNVLVE